MAELPQKHRVSISGILKILGVSRSGYNAWKQRVPSNTENHRNYIKEKIKAGTYDFSEEDAAIEETEEDGVPEELRESEEDIERERIKAERYAKFDKITNWFCLGAFIGALGFVIYRIVSIYFL